MTTCTASKRKRPFKDETGAVLVELALVLPFLIILMLGATDFGRVFFAAVELSNAVTAGAEYGSRVKSMATNVAGIKSVVTSDAADLSGVTFPSDPTSYCTCPGSGTHIACTTTCTGYGKPKEYVSVTANYTWTALVPWPGIPNTVALSRTVVMRAQ
jgi:Flp pilus assembly protein TadG